MKHRGLAILGVIAVIAAASASNHAQQAPRTKRVFFSEVAIDGSASPVDKTIANAAVSMLELKLGSMKDVRASRGEACTAQTDATASPQPPSRGQQEILSSGLDLFYQIRAAVKPASITAFAKDPETILDYEILRFTRCGGKPVSILHRSEPIAMRSALTSLSAMTDRIEAALNEDLAAPSTVIEVAEFSGGGDSLQQIREHLRNEILFNLVLHDFEVRDARKGKEASDADYVVTGELDKDKKRVTIKISAKGGKPENFSFNGPINQKSADEPALASFYQRSADLVVNYIRARVENRGIPTDADVERITRDALTQLCKNQTTPCAKRPEQAIAALSGLRDAGKATPQALELLGNAYDDEQVQEYVKAADSYDRAKAALPAADPQINRLTQEAANAHYLAQNYLAAAERYESAINLTLPEKSPLLETLFVQSARSYRYGNNRVKALSAALSGLNTFRESAVLDEELGMIVKSLMAEELEAAYPVLLGSNLPKVRQKLPELKNRLAEYLTEEMVGDFIFKDKDFDALDKQLKKIEALDPTSLNEERQAIYRVLRSIWLISAKHDDDAAIVMITPATKGTSEVTVFAKYILADALYRRAGRAGSATKTADYSQAVDLLKAVLAEETEFDVYRRLMIMNHELNKDGDSRALIEQKLQAKKDDSESLQALIQFCSEYANDMDCAESNLKLLESTPASDTSVRLLAMGMHLLRGRHAEAEKLLQEPLSSKDLLQNTDLNEILLFYRVWALLALDRGSDAFALEQEWQKIVERQRDAGELSDWILRSAERGVDADLQLSAEKKSYLKQMIAAIIDSTKPVPKPILFQPRVAGAGR